MTGQKTWLQFTFIVLVAFDILLLLLLLHCLVFLESHANALSHFDVSGCAIFKARRLALVESLAAKGVHARIEAARNKAIVHS